MLGYTSSPTHNGDLQAGAIIRLEDPSQTALITDANGQLAYSGTDAELNQVILHEIGHAMGLGDSADPTSIMYSVANAEDRTISSSDITAVNALYSSQGGGGATSTSATQMIQAMASFPISPIGMDWQPANEVAVALPTATTVTLAALT